MIDRSITKLNHWLSSLEQRTGLKAGSLIAGLMLMAVAMLYSSPHFESAYHGFQFSNLSKDPFDFSQNIAVRYRILSPLIGYITFLRGDLFFIIPLLFSLLFISSVYYVYRRRDYKPVDAMLMTALVAFSCTLFIPLFSPGYTDPATYLFVFLAFAYADRKILSAVYFALAISNHESAVFLLPCLLFYIYLKNRPIDSNGSKGFGQLAGFLTFLFLFCLPYLAYRYYVSKHASVEYTRGFYFTAEHIHDNIKKTNHLIPAGAFYAFKLFWFFPLYAIYKFIQRKEKAFALLIISIIAFDLLPLLIVFDITRMLCLGFPAILLSAEKVKSIWSEYKFTRYAFLLVIVNFLVLQYFISIGGIVPLLPFPYNWLMGCMGLAN